MAINDQRSRGDLRSPIILMDIDVQCGKYLLTTGFCVKRHTTGVTRQSLIADNPSEKRCECNRYLTDTDKFIN